MIERLTADTAPSFDRIGGKAAGLVRLLRAGLPVPEAWVIPAGLSLEGDRERLVGIELANWWATVSADFPDVAWAVRSSAVAEDLEDASFAGVYRTVLGVDSLEAAVDAVCDCWAALDDARANAYRGAKELDAGAGIAVVLQRMLRPAAAGVLLTANPRRRFAGEIVVDAAYGLGEAVVSGKVDPDHLVLNRATGEVRSEHIGGKQVETVFEGGLADRPVAAERRSQRCLSDGDLAELHALAVRVGERIGPDRDLEWALEAGRLYALQDRPITGLPPLDPHTVWTRKMGDEYLAEYAMPLSIDLMHHWLATGLFTEMLELQGRSDLARVDPLLHHNGYAYFNGVFMLEVARAFPRSLRSAITGDWFNPLWVERVQRARWRPGLLWGVLRASARDRGRGSVADNPVALMLHCQAIDARIAPRLTQDYTALTVEQWRDQFAEVNEFGLDHFRVIRWGMGQYNSLYHGLLTKLLAKWADDADHEMYHALISGLPGTRTAQLNREIWDLAELAHGDRALLDELRGERPYKQIRAATGDARFWVAFDAFLAAHGHRSASREIANPHWHETPDIVLGFVRVQLRSDELPADPRQAESRAEARRHAALRTALSRAGHGMLGGLRTKVLRTVCERAQIFTIYRENQRYHLDYLLDHVRRLVLEQGRRLTARGVLRDPQDVFLLSGAEFWRAVECGPVDDARLEQRRRHYLTHRGRLPATYLFDGVETEGEVVEGDPVDVDTQHGITGLGASRGTARGRTRVVADLTELATVEAGDVLVASNIDPGWTSVFPLLAGLVTETGGILSHGAILAREYGIPTVTGVSGATALLPTGTLVEVDGARGVIESVAGG